MTLRVVSLNAWGGKLHAPLMRYLTAVQPDILCLQEVVRTYGAQSDWLEYRDGEHILPQRAHLFEEVRAALPRHDGIFSPTARGELFDGDSTAPSEFGLATFIRSTLPIIGQAVDFVHGNFSTHGWGPHPRGRNAHGVRLYSYDGDFPVTIVQLHGLRDKNGKGDTPARMAQAEALTQLIERLWHRGERLIVCGDLNLLPDSGTFEVLGRLGLVDLVTSRGFTSTRTSFYEKDGRFADYMLVTPNVEVVRFDVVAEPEVSDHCALRLEFR
ncbi:MAG: endonuclease/exonuclease/phosphatase family protein [Candidatus Kaistia colombiensis]|nr:MAG: endonuclease/exonuclease/phosphatase family protein [Kaistia sp.]